MQKPIYILLFSLFNITMLPAQIQGLWEVQKVEAGTREVTPIAKWFDLQADGQLLSGNGGIINNRGTWEYDSETNTVLFKDLNGQADPAGAFLIEKVDQKMAQLGRQEEGMQVKIHLQKVSQIPLASWDQIVGSWRIAQILKDGQDLTATIDPDLAYSLFIRWDHLYIARNAPQGKEEKWGVWQIHGHKSEIRMMGLQEGDPHELWTIEKVNQEQLILSKEGDDYNTLVFKRE